MKILAICGRENEYPRNQLILNILSENHEVTILNPLPRSKSILWRSIFGVIQGIGYLAINKVDLIYIGFYSQLITVLLAPFTKVPMLIDAFISTYDTVINDRKTIKAGSFPAKLVHWLDKTACNSARLIFLDTQIHCEYYSREYHIPIEKFKRIFASCDQSIFFPLKKTSNGDPIILTYSTFLPLHGTRTILEAASNFPHVKFKLIGEGPDLSKAKGFVEENDLNNVNFLPIVPLMDLPKLMADADIFLGGHFGTSHKAQTVIAAKTFQALAMALPTIVTENPANREILGEEFNQLFCEHGSSISLSNTIQFLLNNPNKRLELGQLGYNVFLEKDSRENIASDVLSAIDIVHRG